MENEWKKPLNLRVSMKIIMKALSGISGYSIKELKELYIKLGDIGDVGEYVMSNKKQKTMKEFF